MRFECGTPQKLPGPYHRPPHPQPLNPTPGMANDRKNHFFSIDKDKNTKGSQVQDTYIQEVEIQRQIRRYPKLEARNPKP